MKLLTILGIAVGGSLIAVIILFIVKGIDSRQGEAKGLINLQLSACSAKPNCVNSEEGTPSDKKVAPFALTEGQIEQDWDRLQRVIRDHGGELIRVEPGYLAATFSSSLFGFVDDLEARLDKPNNVIQIRSASRVGTSDMGANRTRVALLRQRYAAKP
ncbi:MAG: hypothetical protein ACJAWL_002223 [Motiliproteus sp.]|jgi:uncharacterized protein (DUF1499 family)